MEKNILRVLGDIIAVQRKYNLKDVVQSLLTGGTFQLRSELKYTDKYEEIAKQLASCGLTVDLKDCDVMDPHSYHKTEYIRGKCLTATLPVSPAIEVLFGKKETQNIR